MLKRFILATLAIIIASQLIFSGAVGALELDKGTRTVQYNEEGNLKTYSIAQVEKGKREFNAVCAQCHAGGITKTNPNINLALETLRYAEPTRNHVEGLIDYMIHPTSYDGEIDLTELHPSTERSDIWPEMRNLTEDDLEAIAAHILIQPKIRGILWGGGKAYN